MRAKPNRSTLDRRPRRCSALSVENPLAPPPARRSPLSVAVFIEAPLIFVAFYVWLVGIKGGWHMQDFAAFRAAAESVLHGHSPYPPSDPAALLEARALVYPALVAYLFVPFALLPYGVAAPLYFFSLLAALLGTLRVLQVRDWRCYGAVMLWYPTVGCLGTGAIGPLLALLLALVWRYRSKPVVAAAALSVAVVAKLFLWPMGLWLLATRRWRAAVLTACLGAGAFVLPFLPLGWHLLRSYPKLLRALDGVFGPVSFSATTLFRAFGASPTLARVGVLALGAMLILGVLFTGLIRRNDRAAFMVALAAALLLSPIVWMHYYVVLVVPIAIAMPRLGAPWLVPLLFWASPELESFGELRRLLIGVGVMLTTCLLTALRTPAPGDHHAGQSWRETARSRRWPVVPSTRGG